MKQHFPDVWVSPVIGTLLRPHFEMEIVVPALKPLGHAHISVQRNAHQVLAQTFKSLFKGILVVYCFSLSKTNHSIRVSNEQQDTSVVDSVELRYIGY